MKKLLIAVCSGILRDAIAENLSGLFCTASCDTGGQTVSLLCSFSPDVLLLDIGLPGLDGLNVLTEFGKTHPMPPTVAIGPYVSDYVTQILEQINTKYLLRMPCNPTALLDRILLAAQLQPQRSDAGQEIWHCLNMLGMKHGTRSRVAAACCIRTMLKNPKQSMGTLYSTVAQELDQTPAQVEKCLRDGIGAAWKRRSEHIWKLYFSVDSHGGIERPSNREFVASVAQTLLHIEETTNFLEMTK